MKILAALLTMLVLVADAAAAGPRPNVLMIAIDDMRPMLGCYGDAMAKTPQMDGLAARGMVFERAYAQQALCAPSRVSLLSGRYPTTTRIYTIGPALRSTMPDITTLPQHFKNHGYTTRSIGKVYHVGIDDPASWSEPSTHGKAPRYGPIAREAQARAQAEAKRTGQPVPKKGPGSMHYLSPAFEAPEVADDQLIDGEATNQAIAALQGYAASPQRPFFLALGFNNPHVPWVAPKKYWDLYDSAKLLLPKNDFAPRRAPDFAARSGDDFYWFAGVPADRVLSDSFKRDCLHAYLAAISYVDAQIGRLLATLETTGLARNTIVVLWSDHGYYMGQHGWWGGKHNNYEGATRTALILTVPGAQHPGAKTRSLAQLVDIAPTLVELCGLPAERGFEGRSLVPLLADPAATVHDAAFSWYPKGGPSADSPDQKYLGWAMRTSRWRYVEWVDADRQIVARELYDEDADADENENVADRPEYQAILAAMSETMHASRGPAQFTK